MLAPQTVHIWQLSLKQVELKQAQLFGLLSADEQQRAKRFIFKRDQAHFTIARAGLRILLSDYSNCSPELLRFQYSEQGKPSLALAKPIFFNLAHSHDLAMYAITEGGELGIDIEYQKIDIQVMDIAERYFAYAEIAYLKQCATEQDRRIAFFNGWSRKEAFLKAIGMGLGYSLQAIEVAMQTVAPLTCLEMRGRDVTPWDLYALPVADHYAAAIVLPKAVKNIVLQGEIAI